jgi:hypothetical protein
MEKSLKDKESLLGGQGALLAKLSQAEKGLRNREEALGKKDDKRLQALQAQLAEERAKRVELARNHQDLHANRTSLEDKLRTAASRQGQLQNELSNAENELQLTKSTADDFRSFAAQAEAALAEERRRAELAQKECSELSETRSSAERAKASLEARLAEVERKLKSGEAETLDWAQLLGGKQQDLTGSAQSQSQSPVGVAMMGVSPKSSDGGILSAQAAAQPAIPVATAAASMRSPTTSSVPAAELMSGRGGGGGEGTRGPYNSGHPSLASRDPMSGAAGVGTGRNDSSSAQGAEGWEPVATKLFTRLDRRGNGYVENSRVLQLWPVLSRHVENVNAAAIAAQLLQSSAPMSLREWMSLMKALHTIVGPRRLRRNIRSAEAYFAELQSGNTPAATPPSPHMGKPVPGRGKLGAGP